jgi:hypothetical protein
VIATVIVLAVLAVVLLIFWVSWRASRLDRLHNRVEAARTALDLALVRRQSAAADLASSGQLDPASSLLLADAVRRARQAEAAERDLAESDLTRALRATLREPELRQALARQELAEGEPGAEPETRPEDDLLDEVEEEVEKAARQVFIARKFYNDVAGRTLDARHRPLVRVLHLAGRARLPEFFDMDDALTDDDR